MGFDINPFTPLIEAAFKVIDKVIPDPAEKARVQLEMLRMDREGVFKEIDRDLQLALGQQKINEVEAASEGNFKGGWRPATGWICAFALGYQMIIRPLFGWVATSMWGWTAPPSLEIETLLTLLFGMLGLGAYRSYDKAQIAKKGS